MPYQRALARQTLLGQLRAVGEEGLDAPGGSAMRLAPQFEVDVILKASVAHQVSRARKSSAPPSPRKEPHTAKQN